MLEIKTHNDIRYLLVNGIQNKKALIFLPGLGAFKENYFEHALCLKNYYSAIYIFDLPEQGSKGSFTIGMMVRSGVISFSKSPEANTIRVIRSRLLCCAMEKRGLTTWNWARILTSRRSRKRPPKLKKKPPKPLRKNL